MTFIFKMYFGLYFYFKKYIEQIYFKKKKPRNYYHSVIAKFQRNGKLHITQDYIIRHPIIFILSTAL